MLIRYSRSRIKILFCTGLLPLVAVIFLLVASSRVQALSGETSYDGCDMTWSTDQYSVNLESVGMKPQGLLLGDESVLGVGVISSNCGGHDVGISDTTCSSSGTDVGFTSPLTESAVSFDEKCKINVVQASMPTFFFGCDPNKDGRVDTFGEFGACESPAIADFYGNYAEVMYKDGKSVPSGEVHHSYKVFNIPDPEDKKSHTTPVGSTAEAKYMVDLKGSDGDAKILEGEGLGNKPQKTASESAEGFFSDPKRIAQSAETWNGPSDPAHKEIGNFLAPPATAGVGVGHRSGTTTCRLPEVGAQYRISCINLEGYVKGWIARFTGVIPRARCWLEEVLGLDLNCKRNVVVTLSTQNVIGSNSSNDTPDQVMDTLIASTRPPGSGSSECGYSEPGGQFAACWADDYVYTPAVCEVCGQFIKCWFVWPNFLKAHYERARTERGPCAGKCCDYETYWREIQKCVGGIDPDYVAI